MPTSTTGVADLSERPDADGHEWWAAPTPRRVTASALDAARRFQAMMPSWTLLMTAAVDDRQGGALLQWVQPCAESPPMVVVALPKGLPVAAHVYESGRFALSCVGDEHVPLLERRCGAGTAEDPFLGLATVTVPGGVPVPACAVAWVSCELAFNLDLEADHGLYVARIIAAHVRAPGSMPDAVTPVL